MRRGPKWVMHSGSNIWVIDDHKLRREGTVGFLTEWAREEGIELRQVERAEHICPTELLSKEEIKSQICLLGIGGCSLEDEEVNSSVRNLLDILGERALAVIADNVDDTEVKLAIRLGIKGLIPTFLDASTAILAINYVLAGRCYFPSICSTHESLKTSQPKSVKFVSAESRASAPKSHPSSSAETDKLESEEKTMPELSERQTQVLNALKRGSSNKLIARELGLSEATVKIHVRALINKFGATNRTQVALMASDPTLTIKKKPALSFPPAHRITH